MQATVRQTRPKNAYTSVMANTSKNRENCPLGADMVRSCARVQRSRPRSAAQRLGLERWGALVLQSEHSGGGVPLKQRAVQKFGVFARSGTASEIGCAGFAVQLGCSRI